MFSSIQFFEWRLAIEISEVCFHSLYLQNQRPLSSRYGHPCPSQHRSIWARTELCCGWHERQQRADEFSQFPITSSLAFFCLLPLAV